MATSPDGKIYRVTLDGSSTIFFDPDDKYIWALAVDRAGNVFAATGDKGVIYKITPAGAGTLFYKTNTTNVVALAIAPSGDLIAGTESPGRVFKLDPSGKPFVLLDSPYREVHAVRVAADGTIYAAAMNGAGGERPIERAATGPEPDRPPVPTVSTEITAVGVVDSAPTQPPTTATARPRLGGRGAIYRIRPDGFWDPLWETGEDAPYDVLIEPSGSVLVGTGTDGKIFRISGDPARATLVARAAARQVTALLRESSGRIIGATSNPGKLVALGADGGQARHLRIRRARRRHDGELGGHPLARGRAPGSGADHDAQRQHRQAGRNLERLVGAVRERRRPADDQPERPLSAVAGGADRGRPPARQP